MRFDFCLFLVLFCFVFSVKLVFLYWLKEAVFRKAFFFFNLIWFPLPLFLYSDKHGDLHTGLSWAVLLLSRSGPGLSFITIFVQLNLDSTPGNYSWVQDLALIGSPGGSILKGLNSPSVFLTWTFRWLLVERAILLIPCSDSNFRDVYQISPPTLFRKYYWLLRNTPVFRSIRYCPITSFFSLHGHLCWW